MHRKATTGRQLVGALLMLVIGALVLISVAMCDTASSAPAGQLDTVRTPNPEPNASPRPISRCGGR